MEKNKANQHRSRSEWQAIIAGQKASRQTVTSYCREHGISVKSFYNWRGKVGKFAENSEPKGFIQILSDQDSPVKPLILHIPGGYRLDIPRGADEAHLQAIVRVLRT